MIDTPADLDDVRSYLAEFPEISRERVLLMPQGTDAGAARSARRLAAAVLRSARASSSARASRSSGSARCADLG